ncbi:MAG: glycerophosphodiester phosphodiesterase [Alphaproteobacteria bacterium]|nr:glycerophosphodiester phosphodiesterase [Alphaproteobacteria bacterium]
MRDRTAPLPLGLTRVAGHRGAKLRAPENTIVSFRAAKRLGAGWVELDAKLTRDGVPIVIHDQTLERTTDGAGRIESATLDEIGRLDAGKWFAPEFAGEKVPTLADALKAIAAEGIGVNVEIKPCPGRERDTAEASIAVIREVWPSSLPAPIISSFQHASLEKAKMVAPELPRGLLLETREVDWRETATRLGCKAIHPKWSELSAEWVAEIHKAGFACVTWTVNDPQAAKRLLDWDVDCIITDAPDLIVPVAS